MENKQSVVDLMLEYAFLNVDKKNFQEPSELDIIFEEFCNEVNSQVLKLNYIK